MPNPSAVSQTENPNAVPAPFFDFMVHEATEALGPIWADRLVIDGIPLGDCWRHPAIRRDDASDGLVPLHKLSQWLSYSLIEPLQGAGMNVVDATAGTSTDKVTWMN